MKTFKLSTGETVKVDDDVFEIIPWFPWRRKVNPTGVVYVRACVAHGDSTYHWVWLHRLITNALVHEEVNHMDGDGLNNQRSNIVPGTRLNNCRGFQTKRKNCTSQYRGVCWHKYAGKWIASIKDRVHGIQIQRNLGFFDDEHEAALAYNRAARRLGYSPGALNQIAHPTAA